MCSYILLFESRIKNNIVYCINILGTLCDTDTGNASITTGMKNFLSLATAS